MIRFRRFLRRLVAALAFADVSTVAANDYTDTWWTPTESGWGVNFQQQGDFVFATFYVYGTDGKSIWFSAQMARDGTSERFSGPLYRISGTWFGAPVWAGNQIAQAGTATFTAWSSTAGTLEYNVDATSVTKSIERLTTVAISVAGTYVGGVSGRRSGCSPSGSIVETMQFRVLHSTLDRSLRIDQLSTSTGALVCRMEGTAAQSGKLLTVDGASYSCTDGFTAPARIYNLRPTPGGFEGQWFANAGAGCTEAGQFSGVTQFP